MGNCQPWRFVKVDDPDRRRRVRDSFERSNAEALGHYEGERAALYAKLKLAGLDKAPVQIAVFADSGTRLGQGLGRRTMPETLQYSAVAAVNILWLAARAHGIGVGWISILEPDVVTRAMEVPDHWELIAYLCVGYPEEEHPEPELERYGWQERLDIDQFVFYR